MNTFSKQAFDWIKKQLAQDYEKDNDPKNWRRVDNGNPIHINPETHEVDGGIGGAINGETVTSSPKSKSKGSSSHSNKGKHKNTGNGGKWKKAQNSSSPKSGNTPNKHRPVSKEAISKVYSDQNITRIKDATSKEDVADVLSDAARSLVGFTYRNFPQVGKARVHLEERFVGESRKYIFYDENASLDETRRIAERQLFAMSKILDVIENGKLVGKTWGNNPDHHPELDFFTVIKTYNYKGQPARFTLDITKRHNTPEASEKRAYNINSEGNSSFNTKLEHLGQRKTAKDESANDFYVSGFRFEA